MKGTWNVAQINEDMVKDFLQIINMIKQAY